MLRPPEFYLTPSGDLVVPAELTRVLFYRAHLDDFADAVRGLRPDLDNVLAGMRLAGGRWARAESGTVHPLTCGPCARLGEGKGGRGDDRDSRTQRAEGVPVRSAEG
jgi:hypothetical protein